MNTTTPPRATARTTANRWRSLSAELYRITNDEPEVDADEKRRRVAELVVREAVALGAASAWPREGVSDF